MVAAVNFAPIPQRCRLARLRAIVRMRLILTGLLVIATLAACQDGSLPVSSTSNNVAASASTIIVAPPAVGPACYDTVSRLDVLQEVKKDIARGETRFFFRAYDGGGWHPYGIKGCGKPKVTAMREDVVAGFGRPRTNTDFQCRAAMANFKIDYNRMMAKRSPKSLVANCESKAMIDTSNLKIDIIAYRKRMRLD